MLSIGGQFIFEPLGDRPAYPHEQLGQRRVVRRVVPLQELGRPLLHRRIYPALGLAEAFRPVIAYCLTEKSFFRVVSETKMLSKIFAYLTYSYITPALYPIDVQYTGLLFTGQ